MEKHIVRAFCRATISFLLIFCPSPAGAQMRDIYRITDSTSDSHVEYHRFDIPRGKEVELANLKGPGKVTYFYSN